ncbi:MAG: DEAD/DEAH box helicase, partial [Gaiellaceae bacterium]
MTRLPAGSAGGETDWRDTPGAPRPERLDRQVTALSGIGPAVAKRLAGLGLRSVRDLVEYRPRRYEEAAPERSIADLFGEEEVVIAGTVRGVTVRRPRRRLSIVQARVADATGEVTATWFNQVWLAERLRPGTRVRLRGSLRGHGRPEFTVRSYDVDGEAETADYAPVYSASEELTVKKLRELVGLALPFASDDWDALPAALRRDRRLPLRGDAVWALHRPASPAEAEAGRKRLAYDELLLLQLGLQRRGRDRAVAEALPLGAPGGLVARYRAALPFALTPGQESAIAELDADLARTRPMDRLLQGDVGSGKTVVALYALLRAVENGRQGALMAPTETLAEQHFLTVEGLCAELGVRPVLLTSSLSAAEHAAARAALAAGEAPIAVGTHALIQEQVDFADLAVAVVDEQHRFGVEQRRALAEGRAPHLLHMTATPIPRTLALTV